MLLLHQIGSVKIGDIVRYTVTYTPAHDRILPAPEHLYLRIRNTCNSALRAAFVHGPYTLYVDAYPAHFDPNQKLEQPRQYGVPEFEPMLKAGGTWSCRLLIPESVRLDAGNGGGRGSGEYQRPPSVSWIINVSSQVIFSTSAAVHYELLLARDSKSLDTGGGITSGIPVLLGGGGGGGEGHSSSSKGGHGSASQNQFLAPGKVSDYQRGRDGRHPDQPKGVFTRAVQLRVEDTGALWNKPQLPGWDNPPSTVRVRTIGKEVSVELPSGSTFGAEQSRQQQKNKEEEQLEQQKTLESGNETKSQARQQARTTIPAPKPGRKPKNVHLVVLTHGLHSNLGGDMLYIKESIDLAVQQAKIDRKARLTRERNERSAARKKAREEAATSSTGEATKNEDDDEDEEDDEDEDEDDDEEVIVRGYSGNATRTERGIKYLGKRLARYVLSTTFPDQPFLPSSKAVTDKAAVALHGGNSADVAEGSTARSHKKSVIQNSPTESHRQYKFTKISFIAHSLGGPVQMYAVAYIQKHSPQFFDIIKPVNFIAMASPFLGLNHENPMYVKFALDFGLVGRTGQDLGLTWRAPTIARSGWGALMGNIGENAHKKVLGEAQPESKPLLRILPTGPAHIALKKFRNRTVYSNVVNDGIVPLRTSCLLFLDWQGLGRVEKARREAGLVETVVGFGWSELVGNNVTTPRSDRWELDAESEAEAVAEDGKKRDDGDGSSTSGTGPSNVPVGDSYEVPQPPTDATKEDDQHGVPAVALTSHYGREESPLPSPTSHGDASKLSTATTNNTNPISSFFNTLFKSNGDTASSTATATEPQGSAKQDAPTGSPTHNQPRKPSSHSPAPLSKRNRIYQRSQTLRPDSFASMAEGSASTGSSGSRVTTGQELNEEAMNNITGDTPVSAPPRTSFFESATDIINPKLPSVEFLIDPSKRPRAIFHDRIYHPSDIPAPPLKRRPTGTLAIRRLSFQQKPPNTPRSGASSPFTDKPVSGVDHQDSVLSTLDYDDPANAGNGERNPDEVVDSANMKVEEKIARAYHRGLSWRKVLVKLEPDAHNNMIVRRTFANAFGWPVVKHMVDAHFSDAAAVQMRDDEREKAASESRQPTPTERGRSLNRKQSPSGARKGGAAVEHDENSHDGDNEDDDTPCSPCTPSEIPTLFLHEAEDQATDLPTTSRMAATTPTSSTVPAVSRSPLSMRPVSAGGWGSDRGESVTWSDRDWNDTGDDSDGPAGSRGHDDDSLSHGTKGKKHQLHSQRSSTFGSESGVSVTATSGTTTGPLSPLKNLLPGSFGAGNNGGGGGPSQTVVAGMTTGSPTASGGSGSRPTSPSSSAWNWKEKIVGKQPSRTASMTTENSQSSRSAKGKWSGRGTSSTDVD
ncbi:revertant of glycogen synthase kinase mutation [Ophiostoma piceae UAMH 11346]|uniref:Revertant of glycogen synthase kinase mutation n=1 Tax=Ophiostoma piceae (strain UAMH 11346) TaxID=1262450 RepID=S3C9H0_OPHP1|nr:revertant of glycogen synthase kinase mutation [Ophiostoma piceae UAMH 11346]